MDETLDYQKIGELFVMQYYTQMHKDPAQMYRFYMENSTLTRGGSELGKEEPVIGQKLIHEKIVSLGLQQVHTRIRQVDSHATVANDVGAAIVVQVTGELSVARQPMRPFVQTFVLAQESPKKYYIHNDIFRYQVYDEDLVSETELTEEQVVVDTEATTAIGASSNMENSLSREGTPYQNQEDDLSDEFQKATGTSPPNTLANVPTETSSSWNDQFVEDTPPEVNGLSEETHHIEEPTYTSDMNDEDSELKTSQDTSWASRLKGNTNISSTSSSTNRLQSYNQSSSSKVVSSSTASTHSTKMSTNISSQQPLPQREPKQQRRPQQDTRSFEKKPLMSSSYNSATRSTPDSHQVFVGNLPNGTTEEELKSLFQSFGNVVEVRINPKNFGFIVFDNEDPVNTIIASRSESNIVLHDRKLNIEEKRPTQRSGLGGSGSGFANRKIQMGGSSGGFNNRQTRIVSSSAGKPQRR